MHMSQKENGKMLGTMLDCNMRGANKPDKQNISNEIHRGLSLVLDGGLLKLLRCIGNGILLLGQLGLGSGGTVSLCDLLGGVSAAAVGLLLGLGLLLLKASDLLLGLLNVL